MLFLLSFSSTFLLAQTITIDGNPADWPAVLNSNNTSIIKSFVHDAAETNDDQFTQGTSDVDPVEQWHWNIGQTNNKGDILNTGVALIGTKLFFFGDRFAVNGDAQIGFWFLHDQVAPIAGGIFSGTHKVGDLLILSNFTNGGGGVNIAVYEWVGSGGDIGGGVLQSIAVGGKGGAFVNNQEFPVPTTVSGWNYQSKFGAAGTYVVGSFFEGFVDLAAIGANPCFQNFLMETRNSQAVTASRQDMAAGQFKVLPTVNLTVTLKTGVTQGSPQPGCPKVFNINVASVTSANLVATGANTYTFTITHSDGSAIGSEVSFTGNSNGTATFTINSVLATQFTYRIIAIGSNAPGCEARDTVCIQPTAGAPPCNISGPNSVCPGSTNTFCAPGPAPADFTYTWSVTGDATISGATDGTCVNVIAAKHCGSFTVQLHIQSTSGLIKIDCNKVVSIVDNTPPTVVSCPANGKLECPATPAFGTPKFSDDCDTNLTITSKDVTTPGCGNTFSITRTWTATDDCGNQSTCSQTISVEDHTPPTITCPGPVSVQCDSDIPAADIKSVTTSDACGGTITVTFVGDVASGSCPKTITRTYKATDACGNSATCTQTITVNDITPPVITCPPTVSIECSASSEPDNTGTATATDNCGSVTITHKDATTSKNCFKYIDRTWTATDLCGNSSSCVQRIIITDHTAPVITCTPNVSVNCGNPIPTPPVNDNCSSQSITLLFEDAPAEASGCQSNPFNLNRTWTAIDASGNISTCTQHITFVPSATIASSSRKATDASVTTTTGTNTTTVNTISLNSDFKVKAIPNPFYNTISFHFVAPAGGQAVLVLYNLAGSKLGVVYNGKVVAGQTYSVMYNVPIAQRVPLIYKLSIGTKSASGKMLSFGKGN